MKNNRGFTLIELLVVISVIAILVGVVIPRFKGMQEEANKTKAKAELKTLQTAIESYYINHDPHVYPDSSANVCEDSLNTAHPKIIAAPLYDPFAANGVEYSYMVSDSGSYFVVFSLGTNEQEDITGIGDDGVLLGGEVDDIYASNGTGWSL